MNAHRTHNTDRRIVWYDCGHRVVYEGNVVIESNCPKCDAPMAGRA